MKDDSKKKKRGKVSRREFLKAGVAGLGMAALGRTNREGLRSTGGD